MTDSYAPEATSGLQIPRLARSWTGPSSSPAAAGFVGSHVVDLLLAEGHRVRALDAFLPAAHRERPGHLDPAAEWLDGDLRDPAVAERAVRGVAAVCHQAAMVGLGVDLGDLPEYVGHNDFATAQLLRALAASGFDGPPRARLEHGRVRRGALRVRGARHRGAGAARSRRPRRRALRAALPALRARRSQPRTVPEDAPLDPRSVYAATKLAQEHLCAAFARETGVPVTALRYHNVYGPRMPRDTPYAGVASIFRSAYAAGRAPRVFEDGGQRRDFVHVRDVARANLRALTAPEPVPGAFNVASGTPRTVLDMALALAEACGRDGGAGGHRRVARGRRAPRRRVARARGRAARLPRARGLRGRDGRVRRRAAARLGLALAVLRGRHEQAVGAQAGEEVLAQYGEPAG